MTVNVAWIGSFYLGKNLVLYKNMGYVISYFPSIKHFIEVASKKDIPTDVIFNVIDIGDISDPKILDWLYLYAKKNNAGLFFTGGWGTRNTLHKSLLNKVFPVELMGDFLNQTTSVIATAKSSLIKGVNFDSITETGGFSKTIPRDYAEPILVAKDMRTKKIFPVLVYSNKEIPIIYYASNFFGWGKHLIHWSDLQEFLVGTINLLSQNKGEIGVQNKYIASCKADILPKKLFDHKWYLRNKKFFADFLLNYVAKNIDNLQTLPSYIADALREFLGFSGYLYESLLLWKKAALTNLLVLYVNDLQKEHTDYFFRGKLHYLFARYHLNKSLEQTARHLYAAYKSYIAASRYPISMHAKLSAKQIAYFYLALSEAIKGVVLLDTKLSIGLENIKKGLFRLLKVGASPYGHGYAKKFYDRKQIFLIIISLIDIAKFLEKVLFSKFGVHIPLGPIIEYLSKNLIYLSFRKEAIKKRSYTTKAFLSSIATLTFPRFIAMLRRNLRRNVSMGYNTLITQRKDNTLFIRYVSAKKKRTVQSKMNISKKLLTRIANMNALFWLINKETHVEEEYIHNLIHEAEDVYRMIPLEIRQVLTTAQDTMTPLIYLSDTPLFFIDVAYSPEYDKFLDLVLPFSRLLTSVSFILSEAQFPVRSQSLKTLLISTPNISEKDKKYEINAVLSDKRNSYFFEFPEDSSISTLLKFAEVLSSEPFDIIHYLGHGTVLNQKNIPLLVTSQVKSLFGDIPPSFLIDYPNKPLVFFNICFGGYEGGANVQATNFASASIDAGAPGFIGPSQFVSSKFAVQFARRFYATLRKHREQSIVKILFKTKNDLWNEKKVSAELYHFYGHPLFKL